MSFEGLTVYRRLPVRGRHVHDRALARHDDRFGHASDSHFRVHVSGERTRQIEAVALDHTEPRQRERDRVGAGLQIEDAVLAGLVGHRGA
jgi:hypothetical protein